MTGFSIKTNEGMELRFKFYLHTAPISSKGFFELLPFKRVFYHARVSGQEIWIDDMPPLDIIQENASVFTEPGEAVLGPVKPVRSKTRNCFGIYYGEGKGLDAANIFAKVIDSDRMKLQELGITIWKNGSIELCIEAWDTE